MTRFSVIVPVFNRAHCVADALRSILCQTRRPDEVIVVDDGSTDALRPVLEQFTGRVAVLRQENSGVSAARNAGARAARGNWLTFLDSDDIWMPGRLKLLEKDLVESNCHAICHLGDAIYQTPTEARSLFSMRGAPSRQTLRRHSNDPLRFVISGMTTQSAAIRRDAFWSVGGFDESLRFFEDTDLFCRLALRGKFLISRDVLAIIRRLSVTETALTDAADADPALGCRAQIYTYRKLLSGDLSSQNRKLVRRQLSGAIFRLACYSPLSERAKLLRDAASIHPRPFTARVKSTLAALPGDRGMQLMLRNPGKLDRRLGR